MLAPAEIFALFFVTLGPIKLLGPFVWRVRGVPDAVVHEVAWRAFVVATLAAAGGGLIGKYLMVAWHVSIPALTLAGGIIFFLVALKLLLEQYQPDRAGPAELPASPLAAACSLVFPIILTPYGIAAVISLLARSDSIARTTVVMTILGAVMALDLLAMWFARKVLVGFIPIVLQVLGAVLAVLQVALSVQFIINGLKALNVMPG